MAILQRWPEDNITDSKSSNFKSKFFFVICVAERPITFELTDKKSLSIQDNTKLLQ